jgi:predicted transcriptional regulator
MSVFVFTKVPSREKLAQFSPNQEALKFFENIAKDVVSTATDIQSVGSSVDAAKNAAENAKTIADLALATVQNLEVLLRTSQEQYSMITRLQQEITNLYAAQALYRDY